MRPMFLLNYLRYAVPVGASILASACASAQVPMQSIVKVATISSSGSTKYFYRVINTSPFKIAGLSIGINWETEDWGGLLPVEPVSWTSPQGWTSRVVRTEEEALWQVDWSGPEVAIDPGGTLAGFSLETTTAVQAYSEAIYTVHYGTSPVSGKAQPEGQVAPIFVCVTALPGGGFNAHFSYKNANSTAVELAVGPANFFAGVLEDRGQPTMFQPGEGASFAVQSGSDKLLLTWTVEGTSATAKATDRACK